MTASPWRDLGVRAASALVLVPIGVGSIWLGGAVWVTALSVVLGATAVEWVFLWRARRMRRPADPALLWAGLVYVALAYAALLAMRAGPFGRIDVLFVMAVVWAGDIGAYAAGRQLGGPRLAPDISPGKTWSGAVGGTFCAVLAGAAMAHWAWRAAALALGLSVVAQAGDLLESAIKRRLGAKDSSRLIPGHGGLLDRLDGVLAASPAALAVWLAAGPGLLWRGD